MEREILFRGKKIDNGEWVEGNYIFEDFDTDDFCSYGERRE